MHKKSKTYLRHFITAVLSLFIFVAETHASITTIVGTLKGGDTSGYTIQLISKLGKIVGESRTASNGKFSLTGVTPSKLKTASLQLSKNGKYFGPVVLQTSSKTAWIFFSGIIPKAKTGINLGTISLKSGYALVKKIPSTSFLDVADKASAEKGVITGAGKLGYISASSKASGLAGQDDDHDGIINVYDVDRDGDLIANSFDVGTQSASRLSFNINANDGGNSGGQSRFDAPFTTLYLPINNSLNINIGNVTQAQIDEAIRQNFNIVYFFTAQSNYTGAHVVCDASHVYCRSTADGGSTSIVGGVSESPTQINGQWSAYNADGSGFPNLQLISNFHGGGNVFVGSVNPGVDTADIRPGDVATLEFMSGSRVAESRPITIPSYFVTVPAIKTYNLGAGAQTIDYSSAPGSSSSTPLVVPNGSNFAVTFWRPQRLTLGTETGSFRDIAQLHYGLIISTPNKEFGCAPSFYSNLSSVTPDGDQNLWPFIDTASSDSVPDAVNVLGFTVDLRACLVANGASLGQTYAISLTAAGAEETGGNDRAAQNFFINVV